MNKRFWLKSIAWIIFAVIIGFSIGAALIITIVLNPSRGTILIEVLHLFISWPFIILVVSFAFGIYFRNEISHFIRNIAEIRLPGGSKVSVNQAPPPEDRPIESKAGTEAITLTADQQEVIRQHIKDLEKRLTDTTQKKEQIIKTATELLTDTQRDVTYWRFQYLSIFLVPTTKRVLKWIGSLDISPTKEYYNESWKNFITDALERETILMVLLHYDLIKQQDSRLKITKEGLEFLEFLKLKKKFSDK